MTLARNVCIPAVDAAKVKLKPDPVAGGDGTFVVSPSVSDLLFAGVAFGPSGRRGVDGGVLHSSSFLSFFPTKMIGENVF
jgi:hypothetical protein